MISRRLALSCLIVSLAVSGGLAAQGTDPQRPGPIEQQANPITPENPVPRRTYSIDPLYPGAAAAIEASARVSIRTTVDRYGRVAEARRLSNPLVTASGGVPTTPDALRAAADAMVQSAIDAVRQWQYDPPANGPIAFTVTFAFSPGAEPTLVDQDTRLRGPLFVPAPPPPPPPPGTSPFAVTLPGPPPVRVGGNIRPPSQIRKVNPVYPPEAREAKVQGVVIMEALIGPDGRVADVRVLRSVPLLDRAAVDAVRLWEYEPVLLNGVPVPIIMTVTVSFTLN